MRNLSSTHCFKTLADNAVIAAAYNTYLPVYKQLKEKITYEITVEYVGERNDWFDQENPEGE